MPSAHLHRISANAPDDFSGLEAAINTGIIGPAAIIADGKRAIKIEDLRPLCARADLARRG